MDENTLGGFLISKELTQPLLEKLWEKTMIWRAVRLSAKGETVKNVDPALIDAMQLDAQSWKRGDGNRAISTSSGSIYYIDSDGTLTGGTHLTKGRTAKLSGAVYRRGGPIRVDHITVGLCIEAITVDGKTLVTSPVQSIEPFADVAHAGRAALL